MREGSEGPVGGTRAGRKLKRGFVSKRAKVIELRLNAGFRVDWE